MLFLGNVGGKLDAHQKTWCDSAAACTSCSLCNTPGSMDPSGTKAIVRYLMCNDAMPMDVDTVLGDGDTRLKAAVETEKESIIGNSALVEKYPHLVKCSKEVKRQFCSNHWSKNMTKHTISILKDYKKLKMKGKKMPKGCSLTRVAQYMTLLFNTILKKYHTKNERDQMIPQVFDHMRTGAKHTSQFCRDYEKCYKGKQDEKGHLRLPKKMCVFLKSEIVHYISGSVFKGLGLVMTNNRCESLNKSLRRVLPKSTHRSNSKSRDALVILTALHANHGVRVNLKILEVLNLRGHVGIALEKKWTDKDNRKLYMRRYQSKTSSKLRRKILKRKGKANNSEVKTKTQQRKALRYKRKPKNKMSSV